MVRWEAGPDTTLAIVVIQWFSSDLSYLIFQWAHVVCKHKLCYGFLLTFSLIRSSPSAHQLFLKRKPRHWSFSDFSSWFVISLYPSCPVGIFSVTYLLRSPALKTNKTVGVGEVIIRVIIGVSELLCDIQPYGGRPLWPSARHWGTTSKPVLERLTNRSRDRKTGYSFCDKIRMGE